MGPDAVPAWMGASIIMIVSTASTGLAAMVAIFDPVPTPRYPWALSHPMTPRAPPTCRVRLDSPRLPILRTLRSLPLQIIQASGAVWGLGKTIIGPCQACLGPAMNGAKSAFAPVATGAALLGTALWARLTKIFYGRSKARAAASLAKRREAYEKSGKGGEEKGRGSGSLDRLESGGTAEKGSPDWPVTMADVILSGSPLIAGAGVQVTGELGFPSARGSTVSSVAAPGFPDRRNSMYEEPSSYSIDDSTAHDSAAYEQLARSQLYDGQRPSPHRETALGAALEHVQRMHQAHLAGLDARRDSDGDSAMDTAFVAAMRLRSIAHAVANNPAGAREVRAAGGAEALLESMRRWPGSREVQVNGIGALGALLGEGSPGGASERDRAGVHEVLLRAMRLHPTDLEIQTRAAQLAASLPAAAPRSQRRLSAVERSL
jgi:hypothetical protein